MRARNAIGYAVAALLPPIAACAVCAFGLFYGEAWVLLLPGILLGLTPALTALCGGKKLRIRISSMVMGGAILIWGIVFKSSIRMDVLSNMAARPTLYLMSGMLIGCALTARDAGTMLWDAARGWWKAGLLAGVTVMALVLSVTIRLPAMAALPLLLPFVFGLVLQERAERMPRGVSLALGGIAAACLLLILWAMFAQLNGEKAGMGAQLNAFLFRRARMENVTACVLAGAGLAIRNAISVLK